MTLDQQVINTSLTVLASAPPQVCELSCSRSGAFLSVYETSNLAVSCLCILEWDGAAVGQRRIQSTPNSRARRSVTEWSCAEVRRPEFAKRSRARGGCFGRVHRHKQGLDDSDLPCTQVPLSFVSCAYPVLLSFSFPSSAPQRATSSWGGK